ncbi:MAG: hypothetical protein RIC35_04270 [Marinoscillum sp.]
MSIVKEELDRLYTKYGFTIRKDSDKVRVYLFEKGRYFGADIVPLNSDAEAKDLALDIKKEYSEISYATQVRNYEKLRDAELELYKSFFSYDTTRKRIFQRYSKFAENQMKLNGGSKYEYINSPFEINNKPPIDGNIISNINRALNQQNPQLIIIEAAAGYGKTCTAYEILKFLIDSKDCENPLLTELSRNRVAKIFRYILLDEIDREYPSLNSDLVKHEIQTGRIPLIIDGFDELLDKSDIVKSDKNEVFGEVETMLETIGNLLLGQAKIILTTRKTAIFAGAEFEAWLQKWKNKFEVTRFSIREPRIKDWLGKEKLSVIKNSNIPVEYIANPVLLTYLRNLIQNEFDQHCEEPESFVQKYFYSLLEREMERQDLIIKPEDQYQIFKNVVLLMVEFDSSAESRSFMKEIIFEQNQDRLRSAIDLYPSSNKPTIDNLVDKLANHALLDRKGNGEDMIGFINDFVFGTFIGELMSESSAKKIEDDFTAYMVEIGATAYRVQNKTNKEALWNKIELLRDKFENRSILNFDITLKGKILRGFKESIFQSITAFKIAFASDNIFESCVFINCKFKDCIFDIEAFKNTSFIECKFERCTVQNDEYLDRSNEIITVNCTQEESTILVNGYGHEENDINLKDIEDEILAIIWANDTKYKSQKYMKLMSNFEKSEHKYISKILQELESQGILKVRGLNIFIEINRIKEVEKRINKFG